MADDLRRHAAVLRLDTPPAGARARQGARYSAVLATDVIIDMGYGREKLRMTQDAVVLDRYTRAGGALPLLDGHDASRAPIGSVEQLAADGHALRGVLVIVESDRARPWIEQLGAGHECAVSISYRRIDVQQRWDADGPYEEVTRFEILEISLVAVPADAGAGVGRAHSHSSEAIQMQPDNAPPPPVDRVMEILTLCERAGASDRAREFIASPLSVGEVGNRLLAILEERSRSQITYSTPTETEVTGQDGRRRFSLGRAIRSVIPGSGESAPFEREVSRATARRFGRPERDNGFHVPLHVMLSAMYGTRALTTTGSGSGLELHPTEQMELTEQQKNRSVVLEAGARLIQVAGGKASFPLQTAAATATWEAENPGADTALSQQTFTQVGVLPRALAARTGVSQQLLHASTPDAESVIRNDLTQELLLGLDKAALYGGGSNEPTGILATAAVPVVAMGTNGAVPSLAKLLEVEATLDSNNGLTTGAQWVTTPAVRAKLRALLKDAGSGQFAWGDDGKVLGYPSVATGNMPSTLVKGSSGAVCSGLIFGDFSSLAIASWGGVELLIDPFTLSARRMVIVNAWWLVDVAVRQPKAFTIIKDLL